LLAMPSRRRYSPPRAIHNFATNWERARVRIVRATPHLLVCAGVVAGTIGIVRADQQLPDSLPQPLQVRPGLELLATVTDPQAYRWIEETHNVNAADTTNVEFLQAAPYNLTGSGLTVGVWEAGNGLVRSTHQELTGRVTFSDTGGAVSDHAFDGNDRPTTTDAARRMVNRNNFMSIFRNRINLGLFGNKGRCPRPRVEVHVQTAEKHQDHENDDEKKNDAMQWKTSNQKGVHEKPKDCCCRG
jgi:hypothetical protein